MKKVLLYSSISLAIILFEGCGDNATVTVYDKNITQTTIPCLRLQIFPESGHISHTMKKLYTFRKECPYRLEIGYKNGIHCNSTGNVQLKATEGFPSSYLRFEIARGMKLEYSYYIDLQSDVTEQDLKRAWERVTSDLRLKKE